MGLYVFFLLFSVMSASISGVLPYFYKQFIDTISSGNTEKLYSIILIYVAVRFIDLIVSSLTFLIGDIVILPAGIRARKKVFHKIQDLDFAYYASHSTGSLISAMKRGDGAFWSLHFAIHHRILRIMVGFVVMVIFFSYLNPYFVLLVTLSFIISLVVMKYVVDYNIRTRKAFNKEEDKITSVIVDNIINFETVKLFANEGKERKRLSNAFVTWKDKLWKHGLSFRVLDISIGGLLNTSILIILIMLFNFYESGSFTVGEFVLVLGFVNSFFPRLFDLFFGFRDIAKHYEDITRYFGILDKKVLIKDPEKPAKLDVVDGEIKYDKVTFSYKDGKKNAIKNFSLNIRQGQSIAFVGRSGSGKTTLTKLLMRFYDLDKGQISIDGVNINKFSKSYLRSLIGTVPQEPIMFNNTIAYNIGYGRRRVTQKEIIAAAKMANLHKFITTLPRGYKTNVGERGIKLSGGQKQRLAIARMILSDPEIVVFDEATSQLDSENEKMIQDAFWKAVKNKTTIIIAHRLSTAMRADKIVVLEGGKIIEEGSHNSLIDNNESLYKYLWDLQTAQT